jgi:hypothetical protein
MNEPGDELAVERCDGPPDEQADEALDVCEWWRLKLSTECIRLLYFLSVRRLYLSLLLALLLPECLAMNNDEQESTTVGRNCLAEGEATVQDGDRARVEELAVR